MAVTMNFEEKRPIAMGIVSCGTGVGKRGYFNIICTSIQAVLV